MPLPAVRSRVVLNRTGKIDWWECHYLKVKLVCISTNFFITLDMYNMYEPAILHFHLFQLLFLVKDVLKPSVPEPIVQFQNLFSSLHKLCCLLVLFSVKEVHILYLFFLQIISSLIYEKVWKPNHSPCITNLCNLNFKTFSESNLFYKGNKQQENKISL